MSCCKVCVYAICKDEEKFVDRWMDSMGEADLIVVTDTGSQDGTVEKLRARGATVFEEKIEPWRFDVARNLSLQHVPEDADICVCTDLDEVFDPGWRALLEKHWQPGTNRGKYLIRCGEDKQGGGLEFQCFKAHTRKDYHWIYPVHEVLKYTGESPEQSVFIHGMMLHHFPDESKSRAQYLPLLEAAVEESPQDDRARYYLGREYMYHQMWEKCIETCKTHLLLPTATWEEERCASMRWIAHSYGQIPNQREAYRWFFKAVGEAPQLREPYVEFARYAYEQRDWETAFYMAQAALRIQHKSMTYINQDYAWDHTPDDLAAISCYWLEMYDRAKNHALAALQKSPENPRLQQNLKIIENRLQRETAEE